MSNARSETVLDSGEIPFQTDGRLLQELGLRLVASPEVALVELIKNAYDADSPSCDVRVTNRGKTLIVEDEGAGMTFADFSTKWMRIATSSKVDETTSPKFKRRLTGAKGIGRFAVRYLGDHLTLESVAYDKNHRCKTRLTATFDWKKFDKKHDISKAEVEFTLTRVAPSGRTGTKLTIQQLRATTDFTDSEELRNNVLRIVSPIEGLDRGDFAETQGSEGEDPGFKITLPGSDTTHDVNLASLVLSNYWGRLTIELRENRLTFKVTLPSLNKPKILTIEVPSSISQGCYADIRFFPRRKGVFQGKGFSGHKAWSWIRDNSGVAVVDHGFRIKPYGFPQDDWLHLDADKSHNERDWKTGIAKVHFAISPAQRSNPAANPMLNLPSNLQLVGAVFIESKPSSTPEISSDLIPSMDREGLLQNTAFTQLNEFVRAGIEFLAHEDKAEMGRLAIEKARDTARSARDDLRKAIAHIQNSPTLTPQDKARLVNQYRHLSDRLDEQEEYSAQARQSLTTMSLLGVVAGFMTHESKAIVHELGQAVDQVNAIAKKVPDLKEASQSLTRRLETFKGYLDYSRMFIQKVRGSDEQSHSAAGQARHIVKRFSSFVDDRGIKVSTQISPEVRTPRVPVTVYSGILLNLFTNGVKAVIAAQSSVREPHICIRAWNEKGKHYLEVLDNGVGVPPDLRKRIWEPLYTTTSDLGNPLGSGMGLGLTLLQQVVRDLGGTIALLPETPAGFTTCFRVALPDK